MENKAISIIPAQNDIEFEKPEIFQIYKAWRAIPAMMKFPPAQRNGNRPTAREFATDMGINDPDLLELIEVKDNLRFAEKYGVNNNTLTRWTKHIKAQGFNGIPMMRDWAMELSNNMLMSVYTHGMKKGNPLTMKLWFQLVNDWKESAKVEHTFTPIRDIEHEIYDPIKHGKQSDVGKVTETTGGVQLS